MKKCPYCAEEIQDEAIKCRHCGSMLAKKGMPTWAIVLSCGAGGLALLVGGFFIARHRYRRTPSRRVQLQRACDKGNGDSCFKLGEQHYYGKGRPKDIIKAQDLYERACAKKHALGCYTVGWIWHFGNFGKTAVDHTKARHFYKIACDKGEAQGCHNLGWMWEEGWGGKKDEHRARVLYKLACDKRDSRGCRGLKRLSR